MRRQWLIAFSVLGVLLIPVLLMQEQEVPAMNMSVTFVAFTNTPPYGAGIFEVKNSSTLPVRLFHCTIAGVASAIEPLDVGASAESQVNIRVPVPTTLPATFEFNFQRHFTSREKLWIFLREKMPFGMRIPVGELQTIYSDIVLTSNHANRH